MKVLLIGSGGREHALAWKLAQSSRITQLFVAPGNPGTAQVAENVPLRGDDLRDWKKLFKFITQNAIDLVVIGPEAPLSLGLADECIKQKIKVFGPTKEAAQLESDKWFAKELMRQQAVPTAEARVFGDATAAEEYVNTRGVGVVVKAAGLAAGKGVAVCHRPEDALAAIEQMMRKKTMGEAGQRIVIEELLKGPECSVLAFVDRRNIYVMETAQDHKSISDGDTGPMTGGMGAYSPTPVVSNSVLATIERDVFIPVLDGLNRDGIDYQGVLYAGLMLTAAGPKVLEFNCRFGDPETQPLMQRLKSDLCETMLAVAEGRLDEIELKWDERPAVCVVASARGYPGKYDTGEVITGLAEAGGMPDVQVFHAGTATRDEKIVTAGGRVLAVSALGESIEKAKERAYAAMAKIHFDGMYYRRDIAWQATGHAL